MSKDTSQDSPKKATKGKKVNAESIQSIYDAAHKKFQYQLDLIGKVDSKSGILIALNAGILTFMSSWSGKGISLYLVVIGLSLLILSLVASLVTVYARLLWISPSMDSFLNQYRAEPVNKTRQQLTELVTRDVAHNEKILMTKRKYANISTVSSVCGFILVGVAHIITIVLP